MKEAYFNGFDIDGNSVTKRIDLEKPVDLDFYKWAFDEAKPIEETHACIHCGKPVSLCYKEREGQREPQLEFDHPNAETRKLCPQTFAEDLKLQGVFQNRFDAREIPGNEKAWEKWAHFNGRRIKWLKSIRLGKHLPDEEKRILEAAVEASFAETKARMISMVGITPEIIFGLMADDLGRWKRKWESNSEKKECVGFEWEGGKQRIFATDKDGNKHEQVFPGHTEVLCYGRHLERAVKSAGEKIIIEVIPQPVPIGVILGRHRKSINKHQSTLPDHQPR
jgi:hypothetical protein